MCENSLPEEAPYVEKQMWETTLIPGVLKGQRGWKLKRRNIKQYFLDSAGFLNISNEGSTSI